MTRLAVDAGAAAVWSRGPAAAVACGPNPDLGALGAFTDKDVARSMRIGLLAVADFVGPSDLATCDFVGLPAPVAGDFAVTLVESFAADLTAVVPVAGGEELDRSAEVFTVGGGPISQVTVPAGEIRSTAFRYQTSEAGADCEPGAAQVTLSGGRGA